MDCPMKIPVYYDGQELCQMQVEQVGLYYRFSCRCRMQPKRIMRIYAVCGFDVTPVGILMPVRDEFVLNEKISVRTWPLPTIDAAVCGYVPGEGALPWRGEIDGVLLDKCWLRTLDDGYELLIEEDGGAFPLPAALPEVERRQYGTLVCAALRLDARGAVRTTGDADQEEPQIPAAMPEETETEATPARYPQPEETALEQTMQPENTPEQPEQA